MKPKKVYKYVSLSDYLKIQRFFHIIKTGEVWFSKFHALNDPMEGIFYTSKKKKERDLIANEKNNYLLGCFGEDPNIHPLWAYYAEGYSGACLEIKVNESLIRFQNDDCLIKPIEYKADEKIFLEKDPKIEDIPKLLLRKTERWEKEKEIRILVKKQGNYGLKGTNVRVGSVTKVILGTHISDEAVDYIQCKTKELNEPRIEWSIENGTSTEPQKKFASLEAVLKEIAEYKVWRKGFSFLVK